MVKITVILKVQLYYLIVTFDNGEVRKLNMQPILEKQQYHNGVEKLFDKAVFSNPKIGDFGQIYWENILQMRGLQGEIIPCAYDVSYHLNLLMKTPSRFQ